ncbi:MAG TPA: hypothetical protein VHR40_11625 [Thermoleophilaceae bacterium]|nr:hypothetical protein [Thermoleophilaceae bacterium]
MPSFDGGMPTNRFTLLALPLTAASLFFAACGGGSDPKSAADFKQDMRQAALKYAQCMRKHGVDMPDPQFNGKGMSMQIGGPGESAIPKATMDEAQRACQKIMESVKPPPMSKAQVAKARKRALKMAQCMREKGFDFPDPQFGTSGEIRQKIGPGSGINPEDPRFQQAMQDCGKDAGFRGGPGLTTRAK